MPGDRGLLRSKYEFELQPVDDFGKNDEAGGQAHVLDKSIVCTEFAPDVFAHLRSLDGVTLPDL
jgi:hypothetical protein